MTGHILVLHALTGKNASVLLEMVRARIPFYPSVLNPLSLTYPLHPFRPSTLEARVVIVSCPAVSHDVSAK